MNIEEVIGKSPVITKILDCTTITPLLMHGKENKKLAELRAPSFTGVFRYWFRALQPASSSSMISMFQEESDLFGGTRRKSKKSPLVVSVSSLSDEEHHYNTRPHAPYKKPPTIVPGIPENKSFQLQLQTYLKDEHLFDTVLTYAKISFYLGGFGQRSRRGFGSITITNDEKHENPEQWLDYVQRLISSVSKLPLQKKKNNLIVTGNQQNISHPQLLGVYIGHGYDNAEEALITINETSSKVANAYKGALGDIGGPQKKLASPVIASVKPIGDKFYIVVTEVNNTKDRASYNLENYLNAKKMFLEEVGATY